MYTEYQPRQRGAEFIGDYQVYPTRHPFLHAIKESLVNLVLTVPVIKETAEWIRKFQEAGSSNYYDEMLECLDPRNNRFD